MAENCAWHAMEKSIHSAQYATFLKVFRQTRRRAGLTQINLAKRVGEPVLH